MKPYRIAIVDDVEKHRTEIRTLLIRGAQRYGRQLAVSRRGVPIIDTYDAAEPILAKIANVKANRFPYDVIIADLYMPDSEHSHAVGEGGARRIYDALMQHELTDRVFLVVTTNRGEGQDQIASMFPRNKTRLPWAWYIPKAESIPKGSKDSVWLSNESYVHKLWQAIAACRDRDWRRTFVDLPAEHIIGLEPKLQNAQSEAERFASERLVLLVGEEGVGKEAIAEILHRNSNRSGPFIAASCNAFLRGEVRRMICGAVGRRGIPLEEGLLHRANRGTLYLGNVGEDLRIAEQVCQVVGPMLGSDDRLYRRDGGFKEYRFDGAIVLGVVNPEGLRTRGVCRSLLDRAEAFQITLPRLQDRRDIIGLAEYFLRKYSPDGTPPTLSESVQQLIRTYEWRQNIAELDSKMRYLALHVSEPTIEVRHLPWQGFRKLRCQPDITVQRVQEASVAQDKRPRGRPMLDIVESAKRCNIAHSVICEIEKAMHDFDAGTLGGVAKLSGEKYPLLARAISERGSRPLGITVEDYRSESIESGLKRIIETGKRSGLIVQYTVSQIAVDLGAPYLQRSVFDVNKRDQRAEDETLVRTALCGSDDSASAASVLRKVAKWLPPAERRQRRRRSSRRPVVGTQ